MAGKVPVAALVGNGVMCGRRPRVKGFFGCASTQLHKRIRCQALLAVIIHSSLNPQWRTAPLTLVLAIRLEASLVFLGTAWGRPIR